MVAHRETAQLAARLIRETCMRQGIAKSQLQIHSDRGPAMTSHTVAQLLGSLGVTKSLSRPYVSDDNPFSESQFKTLKYMPDFPDRFGCIDDSIAFCRTFFDWYNNQHRHSGIALLTPAMVHHGQADRILSARDMVLSGAYGAHPERFVRGTPKPLTLPEAVWINPPLKT